jgi:hypothetical protein
MTIKVTADLKQCDSCKQWMILPWLEKVVSGETLYRLTDEGVREVSVVHVWLDDGIQLAWESSLAPNGTAVLNARTSCISHDYYRTSKDAIAGAIANAAFQVRCHERYLSDRKRSLDALTKAAGIP